VFCTPTGGYLWKFDRTWRAATIAAGLRGVFFHDLRRSAIRDMIRGGVSVPVAMSLSGHKTLSVFNRYNITTAEDQIAAVRALSAYRALASATPGERGEAPVAVLKRS
jgi:integrase